MAIALAFDRVSKHYRGAREYRALRDDLAGAARRALGGKRRARQTVKALDGLTLEIPEGQSFALIGSNGAGKTTALKLATRIAYPTSGRVRVRGRVGALIEVGTGMHPELTGRENVQLYGRILGFSKQDVQRRFDEIIDFAGIAAAIDRPVKQYSSGMQLRLGFAVAAHLEPDVLLVDEAIAVGDAGFQYRCVERMSALVREGRTLVFVSHDMTAIETLCTRAALLVEGKVGDEGPARAVIESYLGGVRRERAEAGKLPHPVGSDELRIVGVQVLDTAGQIVDVVSSGEPMTVRVHFEVPRPLREPLFTIGLCDSRIGCFATASMLLDGGAPSVIAGRGYVDCTFLALPLQARAYEIWATVRGAEGHGMLVDWQRLRLFEVSATEARAGLGAVSAEHVGAPVLLPYSWDVHSEAGP